ncbi:serine hydrolase [Peribacillus deserti]|uniref:serine-type D-Ala-D-Ala carboxypeptidase n=1 Tax=Peribacillus deserti TaxID=673318 RepID=A0A2N5LZY4_9BACI|nr:serine hydrolase [Peribacillus deserti]PLT27672.1 D-alanyl-D-alanine carboxypeptidase [Peribacillus deserti]
MKKVSQITLILTLMVALIASQFSFQASSAHAEDTLGLKAEAAILLDSKTGKIVYEKNADAVLGVASMSKMMAEYSVLEAIKDKKLSWDQKVKINHYVHELSKAPGLSNIGLTEGEDYTVKELYEAMAIFSGNAATVALAELLAGSEKNYINFANKKAKELGLKHAKFVNASGLNNSDLMGNHPAGNETDENIMSARDIATLAFHLINDFPESIEYSKIPKLKFRDGEIYPNFNWMLPGLNYEYDGVDGLKTGSTDFAGYCFTATAERDGQRFISVIMKADSKDSRFTETKKILDYGFNNFKEEQLLPAKYQVKGKKTLSVDKGKEDSVKIVTKAPVKMVIRNGEKKNYQPALVLDKKKLNENGELTAPVKKGETVGYITVKPKDGQDFGFLLDHSQNRVEVIAAESVEKANWFVLSMRGVGSFFGNVWSNAASAIKGLF